MLMAQNEYTEFWLNLLTELKNRGLLEILINCVDRLKSFPDAVNSVNPYPAVHYPPPRIPNKRQPHFEVASP